MIHNQGEGFEVEFITIGGITINVETLNLNDIREISTREIAHVRVL